MSENRIQSEVLPEWIPDLVELEILHTINRSPIDLNSQIAKPTHFVSQAELEDLRELLAQIDSPVLIGLHGSRADLARPPLFVSVEAFDAYHKQKATLPNGIPLDWSEYLEFDHGVTQSDYDEARRLLSDGNFNTRYLNGERFPDGIVGLLVSDIDIVIIAKDVGELSNVEFNSRSGVHMDLTIYTPEKPFPRDPDLIGELIELQLSKAVPIKL